MPSRPTRTTGVWLLLMLATAVSWGCGTAESGGPTAWRAEIGTALLVIAAFKVRLIVMYFMEVGQAPRALRWVCEAWIAGLCTALIVLYRFAAQ